MSDHHSQLRVLTLNVWGLKYISKERPPRIAAIIDHIVAVCEGRDTVDGDHSRRPYDVVCLQECWIFADYEQIREGTRHILPESRFFKSGALGSGLVILSRYPIVSTTTLPYSLSGPPHHVIEGDFFVNKSAGAAVLLHPLLGEVEVWSTHMHAAGEQDEVVQSHRITQAWELSKHIRAGAERGRYVIAAGDYNSSPWSLPIAILKDYGCLLDSWLEAHPAPPATASTASSMLPQTAREAIEEYGITVDSPLNTWSAGKPLTDAAKRWQGKRLDYIFYRGPEIARNRPLVWKLQVGNDGAHGNGGDDAHDDEDGQDHLEQGDPNSESMKSAPVLTCTSSQVLLTDLVPGQEFSYSDHFGLCSTFDITRPTHNKNVAKDPLLVDPDVPTNRPLPRTDGGGGGDGDGDGPSQAGNGSSSSESWQDPLRLDSTSSTAVPAAAHDPVHPAHLAGAPKANEESQSKRPPHPRNYHHSTTKSQTIHKAITTLGTYHALSHHTSIRQLGWFAGSICLALALTISSAWQPKSWIQPIWTLAGVAVGAMGVTMLYFGFIWGRWENNRLWETVEEMELELKVSEMERRAAEGTRTRW